MPRPPKQKPNRSDQRYEVKLTLGKDINGKLIRKSFYSTISKVDAQAKADEYKISQEVSKITGIGSVSQNHTFAEIATMWLLKYKKGKVKESTYDSSYRLPTEQYLIPYFGESYINLIKPAHISEFYTLMSEKFYESTLKKIKICLNAIFEAAIENDLCIKNPAKNINYTVKLVGEKKRTYSESEVNTIKEFALTHKYGLYIYILLELGLRCSELCGLKWSDFDLEKQTVSIQRAVTEVKGLPYVSSPKSKNSNRTLPMSKKLTALIKEQSDFSDNFILTTSSGTPVFDAYFTKTKYKTFFKDLGQQFDIPMLTPHELRHTTGTLLYEKSKDIFAVSKFLGHSSIKITANIYVHDNAEMLRQNLGID